MNKNLFIYGGLTLTALAGIFIKGFFGGLITGFSLTLFLLVVVGKWQLKKAAKNLETSVKKLIIENI